MMGIHLVIFIGARYLLMLLLNWVVAQAEKTRLLNSKPIPPAQVQRESKWPIGLLFDCIFFIVFSELGVITFDSGPFWASLCVMVLAHIFLVEPIYYAYHRLLHLPWFYHHHHIHHHKSIVVKPVTSMTFTMTERLSYTILFAIPTYIAYVLNVFDFTALVTFYLLFDLLNSLGHFNLQLEPAWYKRSKIVKLLVYSPEYHEKHHSKVMTNYSLFMPIFDKLFNTFSKD